MRGRLANVPFCNVPRRLLIKTDTQTNAHKQVCTYNHTHTCNIHESVWHAHLSPAQSRSLTQSFSTSPHLTPPPPQSPSLALSLCWSMLMPTAWQWTIRRRRGARVYRIKVKFKASRSALITHTLPHTHSRAAALVRVYDIIIIISSMPLLLLLPPPSATRRLLH